MTLKDTEEKLYDPESDLDKREYQKGVFDIENAQEANGEFSEDKIQWNKPSSWLGKEKRNAIYAGAVVLGLIIFGAGVFFVINKLKETAFSEKNVIISIEGPTAIGSAKDVKYVIKYKNKNRVSLKDVELVLNHTENFYPDESPKLKRNNDRSSRLEIEDVGMFGSGEIEITGKFYAAENYTVYLQPTLKYKPSNFNSFFEATSQLGVRVINSPIALTINSPKEALDESAIEYEINYKNTGASSLDGLNLRLEYSEGFIFQGATPMPVSGNNIWYLGNLNVGADNTIKIKGSVDGNQYDVKLIKATIYKNQSNSSEVIYGRAEGVTKIVMPPLTIVHKIDGNNAANVNLGDILRYKINYSNRGEIGFKDVIVKLKIDSPIIDYEKMDLPTGAYSSTTKDITWKASDIEGLKKLDPGDAGMIDVFIPLKDKIDIASIDDKNFLIESVVTIDSSDIAFRSLGNSKNISNTVIAKLNSRVILESKVFYKDSNIENFGPIPQKIGEETTYTVNWKVSNISNGISDVKVSAFLPTWIVWKNVIFPEGENISFNERTHEVIWNIGKLENGRGILNAPKEVKFKIGLTPEINQIGNPIDLVYETKLTGKDDFTLEGIEKKVGNINNNLEEFTNN